MDGQTKGGDSDGREADILRPMPKHRSIVIAVPAFLLGVLVTASMTSVARAQDKPEVPEKMSYHIVTDEASMNKYAAEGYVVEESDATNNHVWYLMQKPR